MPNNDAQTESIYNAKDDAANLGTATNNLAYLALTGDKSGLNVVQTPVTATAFQVSQVRSAQLYITVNTAAALAVAMGPTAATAIVIAASASYALGVIDLEVPAGWYVKLTGTMANLLVTSVTR